jgi:hypothetical protein
VITSKRVTPILYTSSLNGFDFVFKFGYLNFRFKIGDAYSKEPAKLSYYRGLFKFIANPKSANFH